MGDSGSYRARTVGFDSSILTCVNALSCSGDQLQTAFLLRSSLSGFVRSANFDVNFPSWLAIPINLLNSEIFLGCSMSETAVVLSGSALMPSLSMRCPRNFSFLIPNPHLSGLGVTPDVSILWRASPSLACICAVWEQ